MIALENLDKWNKSLCVEFIIWFKKNKQGLFQRLIKEFDEWRRRNE